MVLRKRSFGLGGNHDILIDRLSKRIHDTGVIRLVRAYLNSGIMSNGVVLDREEGTPQGGPLSPLLANVMLDEVDKELERRGYSFARYADDCNVYVGSRKSGERVMALLKRLYAKLHLRVNESKSALASAYGRKFLGSIFQFRYEPEGFSVWVISMCGLTGLKREV
jgi:RNA-directed DNA polymerase